MGKRFSGNALENAVKRRPIPVLCGLLAILVLLAISLLVYCSGF